MYGRRDITSLAFSTCKNQCCNIKISDLCVKCSLDRVLFKMHTAVLIRGMNTSYLRRRRAVWLAWWTSGFSSCEHAEGSQPFTGQAFGKWTQSAWYFACCQQNLTVPLIWSSYGGLQTLVVGMSVTQWSPHSLLSTWKFPITTRWFKGLINNWCPPNCRIA